jgi:hypothetical protein
MTLSITIKKVTFRIMTAKLSVVMLSVANKLIILSVVVPLLVVIIETASWPNKPGPLYLIFALWIFQATWAEA